MKKQLALALLIFSIGSANAIQFSQKQKDAAKVAGCTVAVIANLWGIYSHGSMLHYYATKGAAANNHTFSKKALWVIRDLYTLGLLGITAKYLGETAYDSAKNIMKTDEHNNEDT